MATLLQELETQIEIHERCIRRLKITIEQYKAGDLPLAKLKPVQVTCNGEPRVGEYGVVWPDKQADLEDAPNG